MTLAINTFLLSFSGHKPTVSLLETKNHSGAKHEGLLFVPKKEGKKKAVLLWEVHNQCTKYICFQAVWIHHSQQSSYHLGYADFFPNTEDTEFKILLCSSNSICHLSLWMAHLLWTQFCFHLHKGKPA